MQSINDRRLAELNKQVASLQQRQAEQQSTVEQLRRELEQAREQDLNAEAKALQAKPGAERKPKARAPEVERALQAAERDLEIVGRALALAQSDRAQYLSQHHQELGRKLQEARGARAREVSELAAPLLEALRSFYAVDDDERILAPYTTQPAEENHGEPQSTTVVYGPFTTQNVLGSAPERIAGLMRGQMEGVLGALVALPSEAKHEVTVVGPVPDEDEDVVA